MNRPYEYKELKIVDKLTIKEDAISSIFKFFGYTFCYIESLYHTLIKSRLPVSFSNSESYEENGETVYRRKGFKSGLDFSFRDMKTIPEIVEKTFRIFTDRNLLGYRKIISERVIVDENEKPKTLLTLGNFEWLTYSDVHKRIIKCTTFLKNMNFAPKNKLIIFADTCVDWLVMALAVLLLRGIFVTLYPTLPDSYITSCINLSEANFIFVDKKSLKRVHGMMRDFQNLKYILKADSSLMFDFLDFSEFNVECFSLQNIFETTNYDPNFQKTLEEAKPEDEAVLMFTSGSTGSPKGVLISHRNIASVLQGVMYDDFLKDQTYAGYLPLSHIFELSCELECIFTGGKIGYCNPGTLFDESPFIEPGCKGDLNLLQPTRLVTVPLILERIIKKFMLKLNNSPRIKRVIFQTLYNIKSKFINKGYKTQFLDVMFSKKFLQLFGGKVEYILVGGAYLPKETEEFFNVVFCYLCQGYGTTEICCGGAVPSIFYSRHNNIGAPFGCSEFKIIPWEEGGYTMDGKVIKKGELLVSGPCVSYGYFKNEQLTAKYFIKDEKTGKLWYHTSDIVELLDDGTFRIIGRKDDVIKLSHGEFVQCTAIETVISLSKFVDFVCVTPDSKNEILCAIICLNEIFIKELAVDLEIPEFEREYQKLLKNKKIIDSVEENISEYLKNDCSIDKFHTPKKYAFVNEQWTPESDLLTPSMKVKRHKVIEKYRYLLD